MSLRPSPARPGFTLVEVLVALAIFGMMAVVLGAAYLNILNSYNIVGKDDPDAREVSFCRSELITQPDFQTAENGDEYTTSDGRTVQWSAAMDQNNLVIPSLWHVVMTVEISSPSGSNRTLTRDFMLLRPTWDPNLTKGTMQQAETTRIMILQGRQQQ